MSDAALGRGQRVSVQTPDMIAYQADRNKTKQAGEKIARTKNVQSQEQGILAQEQANQSGGSKGKPKAKQTKTQPENPPMDHDLDEKAKSHAFELRFMIAGHYRVDPESLRALTLAQLEA
ncbi:hypothetical protein FRC07_010506, partial [Ceratobasidium sp. 392]